MFNIVVVQLYLVFYRLAATYKYSWLQYIYGNVKVLYISFFITILVFQVTTITPIIYDGAHPEEVRRLTASDLPVMAKLIEIQPSIAGYHPALAKGGIDFLLLFGVVIICLLPGIVIALLVFFSYRLRSLVVQIMLLVGFLLLPAEIFILTIYFELSWGSYAAAGCVVVCSFHMAFDSLALLYFIKPYRYAIRRKLRYFLRPLSHAVGPISTSNQHVLPSIHGKLYH
uniref:Uncharacterized protein n=1 Tax=Panagrolaimus davidi TaxID=227884 RepID=A0A914QXY1_9BILA